MAEQPQNAGGNPLPGPPPWRWTHKAIQTAHLVADGYFTIDEICQRMSITLYRLQRWKKTAEFARCVDQLREAFGDECQRLALGRRIRRVEALIGRWQKLDDVIAARAARVAEATAATPQRGQPAPGAHTGLMARSLRGLGSGDNFRVIVEYKVDIELLKEMREIEKQIAIEVGQWSERREHSIPELDAAIAAAMAKLAGLRKEASARPHTNGDRGAGALAR